LRKSKNFAYGALSMLGAQVVVMSCQFVYAFFTARVFAPIVFGEFALLLSLQVFLTVASVTGLPAYILRLKTLNRLDLKRARLYALRSSLLSTFLFLIFCQPWLATFELSLISREFIPALALALLLNPFANVESALLRREGRRVADSLITASAFVFPAAVALIFAFETRSAGSLSIVTLGAPVVTLVLSRLFRETDYRLLNEESASLPISFAIKVAGQNLVFFFLYQLPTFFLGLISSAANVGFYSRALVLTQVPAASLTEVINRPLQPMWRHLDEKRVYFKGISDAVVVASCFSFSLFGGVFLLGPSFARIWLGPGWELTSNLIQPMALFAAFYIPYATLSNSMEMKGDLKSVRISQLFEFLMLLASVVVFTVFREPVIFLHLVALGKATALATLVYRLEKIFSQKKFEMSALYRFLNPILWSCLLILTVWLLLKVFVDNDSILSLNLPEIGTGVIAFLVVFSLLFRFQLAAVIIQERGFNLPKFLTYRWKRRL